jgi:hypothetical protein
LDNQSSAYKWETAAYWTKQVSLYEFITKTLTLKFTGVYPSARPESI